MMPVKFAHRTFSVMLKTLHNARQILRQLQECRRACATTDTATSVPAILLIALSVHWSGFVKEIMQSTNVLPLRRMLTTHAYVLPEGTVRMRARIASSKTRVARYASKISFVETIPRFAAPITRTVILDRIVSKIVNAIRDTTASTMHVLHVRKTHTALTKYCIHVLVLINISKYPTHTHGPERNAVARRGIFA